MSHSITDVRHCLGVLHTLGRRHLLTDHQHFKGHAWSVVFALGKQTRVVTVSHPVRMFRGSKLSLTMVTVLCQLHQLKSYNAPLVN